MAVTTMDLLELLRKADGADVDFLREGVRVLAQALMDQALALQTTDPAAADKLWERVDRALTDQAAWIPYATPRQHRFVSKRVGNYQSHPVWGILLDQLWVR